MPLHPRENYFYIVREDLPIQNASGTLRLLFSVVVVVVSPAGCQPCQLPKRATGKSVVFSPTKSGGPGEYIANFLFLDC